MEKNKLIHGCGNFETAIDRNIERHDIVSYSKKYNSPPDYKWTDGKSSDSRILITLGVLEHKHVFQRNGLWDRQILGYWDNIMGTRRVNSVQRARDVKYGLKHILYIPWFTGGGTRGALVINSTAQNHIWQDCLLSYELIEPLQQQCIVCTIKHTIVFTEQRFMA
jgi:hypothetical protein